MKIIQNAKRIIPTNEIIVSTHVHDFVEVTYRNPNWRGGNPYEELIDVFVDGGNEYFRGSLDNPDYVEKLYLTDQSSFEELKQKLVWGTYGKNQDQPLKYIKLIDAETAHLENIVKNVLWPRTENSGFKDPGTQRSVDVINVINAILQDRRDEDKELLDHRQYSYVGKLIEYRDYKKSAFAILQNGTAKIPLYFNQKDLDFVNILSRIQLNQEIRVTGYYFTTRTGTKTLRVKEIELLPSPTQEILISLEENKDMHLFKSVQDKGIFIAPSAIIETSIKNIGEGCKIWHHTHICKGASIGKRVTIGENCYIGPNVVIGDDCKIQNGAQLFEGITLGHRVFCGPGVTFTNDVLPLLIGLDEWKTNRRFRETVICNDVSIGANSTILAGVIIWANAIIGCGSVVIKDISPNTINVGNPTSVVKTFTDQKSLLKQKFPSQLTHIKTNCDCASNGNSHHVCKEAKPLSIKTSKILYAIQILYNELNGILTKEDREQIERAIHILDLYGNSELLLKNL